MASLGRSPATPPVTLLVVDGDQLTRTSLQESLQHEGYRVLLAGSGNEALRLASQNQPDLMLLEIDLPDISGFEVCRVLRPRSVLPIVILSERSDALDKVLSLELGADDYLTKPFSWRELLARVHAQLRRTELGRQPTEVYTPPPQPVPSQIIIDDLTIILSQHLVIRAGQPVSMTPKEFELLVFLALHPRQVFSRHELLQKVWGQETLAHAKTVDVHVRWLRSKLEADPANPQLIQTVYGIGYKLG